MTRKWAHYRLRAKDRPTAPGPVPASALADTVAALRAADAGSRWFFHRGEGDDGQAAVDVWFHTYEAALADASARLDSVRAAGRPGGPGPRTLSSAPLAALASASSDLALEFALAGGGDEGTHHAVARRHLSALAALVPEADRPGFLFLCWQSAAAGLSPATRLAIAGRADRFGAEPEPEAGPGAWPGAPTAALWDAYLDAARGLLRERGEGGLPVNYLLFQQARDTHARLGLPATAEAYAARSLRAGLHAEPAARVLAFQPA